MPRKIIWSDKAISDYSSNVDYLLLKWSIKDAREFTTKVHDILNLLPSLPEMFPLSDYKDVRKGIVCKQISILYQVKKSEIILLRFWDNRQNPKKKKI